LSTVPAPASEYDAGAMARRPSEETIDHAFAVPPNAGDLCLAVTQPDREPLIVRLPASGAVTVGRDDEAALVVESPSLSRLHFVIEMAGGAARLRDLGSRNGTRRNGELVSESASLLAPGDEIAAGDVRFTLLRRETLPSSAIAVGLRSETPAAQAPPTDVPPEFRYPSLEKVHAVVRRVAPRNISLLILGETGTGKEVLAREIHRLSKRTGPLVAVNTASLPETLIESELFGHERGAFSGALTSKAGLIETSDGGTLFLDEIGELPLALQAKLLRVLEERSVRRVGANQEKRVDLRVVAATHRDLETLVAEKRFRADLLFRLNGVTLTMPPLRERREEIGTLSQQLLAGMSGATSITPAALRALRAFDWPGNVRELRHVLERAMAFSDGPHIDLEHLPDSLQREQKDVIASEGGVRATVKDFERERILEALEKTGGNRTKAAELLGLPRRTLVYKLSKLKLGDSSD
jgi:two-component system, NtrC family, response regulator AtoC